MKTTFKINQLVKLSEVRNYLGLPFEAQTEEEIDLAVAGANMENINAYLVQKATPNAPEFMIEHAGGELYRVIEARYKFDGDNVVAL